MCRQWMVLIDADGIDRRTIRPGRMCRHVYSIVESKTFFIFRIDFAYIAHHQNINCLITFSVYRVLYRNLSRIVFVFFFNLTNLKCAFFIFQRFQSARSPSHVSPLSTVKRTISSAFEHWGKSVIINIYIEK